MICHFNDFNMQLIVWTPLETLILFWNLFVVRLLFHVFSLTLSSLFIDFHWKMAWKYRRQNEQLQSIVAQAMEWMHFAHQFFFIIIGLKWCRQNIHSRKSIWPVISGRVSSVDGWSGSYVNEKLPSMWRGGREWRYFATCIIYNSPHNVLCENCVRAHTFSSLLLSVCCITSDVIDRTAIHPNRDIPARHHVKSINLLMEIA